MQKSGKDKILYPYIDRFTYIMHIAHMATKTISIKIEAYERLKRARRHPDESFSEVVMRARWDEEPVTAGDYLRLVREHGPSYSTDELERLQAFKESDLPPVDKWKAD
jgi:hypothetical protein